MRENNEIEKEKVNYVVLVFRKEHKNPSENLSSPLSLRDAWKWDLNVI